MTLFAGLRCDLNDVFFVEIETHESYSGRTSSTKQRPAMGQV